jgi:hypothetical protein
MENRTKPYVFSHKARPGVDVGNMVRGVDFGLVWLPPFIVKLIFNEIIDCAVPLGLVMEGCSLHWNGCLQVVDCRSR